MIRLLLNVSVSSVTKNKIVTSLNNLVIKKMFGSFVSPLTIVVSLLEVQKLSSYKSP